MCWLSYCPLAESIWEKCKELEWLRRLRSHTSLPYQFTGACFLYIRTPSPTKAEPRSLREPSSNLRTRWCCSSRDVFNVARVAKKKMQKKGVLLNCPRGTRRTSSRSSTSDSIARNTLHAFSFLLIPLHHTASLKTVVNTPWISDSFFYFLLLVSSSSLKEAYLKTPR